MGSVVKKYYQTTYIQNLTHAVTKFNKRVKSANRPDSENPQIIDQKCF